MVRVPSQSITPVDAAHGAFVWPLLAALLLLGIALVSLIDILTHGAATQESVSLPPELEGSTIVLVAPGAEHIVGQFERPAQVRVQPTWEPLPELGDGYVVALAGWAELPRLPDNWYVVSEREAGEWRLIELRTDTPAIAPGRFDLIDHLDRAEVQFRGRDGTVVNCDDWRFGRWSCGLETWLWVGPFEQLVAGRMRRCIWAHPKEGYDLVIRFPGVPHGRWLAGNYGLSDSAVETPNGAPIQFVIRIGESGRPGAQERQLVAQNRRGFPDYHLVLEEGEEPLDIEFVVSAAQDGRRHFCFTGVVHGAAGSAPATEEIQSPAGSDRPPRGPRLPGPLRGLRPDGESVRQPAGGGR